MIDISDLFNPAPSGIGPQGASPTPPDGSWMAQELANAVTLGFTPTAWQPGSPTRSWLALSAVDQAKQDAIISGMIQGGFLDYASTGTVSYTDTTGATTTVPVSPDPSDPSSGNTTGAPTWLDLLVQSVFGLTRNPAYAATPSIAFVNTSASTPSTYGPGTYHVQDASTLTSTYSNDAPLTIPPSSVLGGSISSISNSGTITLNTSAPHGASTGQAVFITGAPVASNANGFWIVTVTGASSLLLQGSTSGSGGSGGKIYTTFSAPFTADAVGTAFSAAAGDISAELTTNSGVSVWNFAPCTGVNYESNVALAARARLSRAALSPNGASGAYQYFALEAYQILLSETPPLVMSAGPVTRASTTSNGLTGAVTTVVAPSSPSTTSQGSPVLLGATALIISGATNASPIALQYSGGTITNGETVVVSGVLGNYAANGTFVATVVDGSHVTLNGSVGNGTYTGGGQIDAGDLGLVDSVIQNSCVPDGDTAYTVPGLTQLISISATVMLPAAQESVYVASVNSVLEAYINSLPIGGVPLNGGGYGLSIDVVIGILYQAGVVGGVSYVRQISGVTVNGAAVDLQYSSALLGRGVGVLYPAPVITVQGV